ncbi:MAG: aminotransferase class V-fold PLP-dependent enzyme, partial [candidate division Zixibacteria bacterium]|nr:aminotransferase class V-fold PLP-dependent enzyme [candidate division Zixibacteria bacterium]
MYNIAAVRKMFPNTRKTAYFNTAAIGPIAEPAYKIQDDYFQKTRRGEVGNQSEVFAALDRIRANAAKIFGCRTEEAGFGFNTTFGINLAAFGLPLKPGDEVLLSDVEFPANVYPWLELRRRGIRVTFLKNRDGCFDIDGFERSITRKTKVLSLSFVQFFNGYKNDMATLGKLCRKHGLWFVVDAIQGAGAEPMQVAKWNVDIASAGAQKWMLSPQGTGIFYVSEETKKRLIAPWRSWLGVDWECDWSNLRDFSRPFESSARQYELGTYPGPLVLSMDWTLTFINRLTVADIQAHNHALLDRLIAYLENEPYYRITSCLDKRRRSSILTFTVAEGDIPTWHRRLVKAGIATNMREGAIRVSVHLYNHLADINRLI